ncbi:hypothetical protein L1987_84942 [Smallanthus sonchifolius]|uniref:Uncharacterized protein n=1 Tax=Smallanthus sonchifolius TaxID=185202 RepID=A0ACB8XV45_9ASTR|nr:hypothetical protein L1987_84942 [Smallanthus sonchifolius]
MIAFRTDGSHGALKRRKQSVGMRQKQRTKRKIKKQDLHSWIIWMMVTDEEVWSESSQEQPFPPKVV